MNRRDMQVLIASAAVAICTLGGIATVALLAHPAAALSASALAAPSATVAPPWRQLSPTATAAEAPVLTTTVPASATTEQRRPTIAPTTSPKPKQPGVDNGPGCAARAMQAGKFNPSCAEYQGYLDPGTSAGRGPTSGELQQQYGCAQGYIPKAQCR